MDSEEIDALRKKKEEALGSGGERAIARQHEQGKLTARERIAALLDEDSFVETDMLVRHRSHGFGIEDRRPYSDAVVTGWARSIDAKCSCSPKTSPCSGARWARSWLRRSAK